MTKNDQTMKQEMNMMHTESAKNESENPEIQGLVRSFLAEDEMIRNKGRVLSEVEIDIAVHCGVQDPAKIRVLELEEDGVLEVMERSLRPVFAAMGITGDLKEVVSDISGVCMGAGVILNVDVLRKCGLPFLMPEQVKAHGFTQVAQIERMGMTAFLTDYMQELRAGTEDGPLEREAAKNMMNPPHMGNGLDDYDPFWGPEWD